MPQTAHSISRRAPLQHGTDTMASSSQPPEARHVTKNYMNLAGCANSACIACDWTPLLPAERWLWEVALRLKRSKSHMACGEGGQ